MLTVNVKLQVRRERKQTVLCKFFWSILLFNGN